MGQCDTCRFWWLQSEATKGSVARGECRRRSPSRTLHDFPEKEFVMLSVRGADPLPEDLAENQTDAVWPMTRDWDWCGEYEKSDTKQRRG